MEVWCLFPLDGSTSARIECRTVVASLKERLLSKVVFYSALVMLLFLIPVVKWRSVEKHMALVFLSSFGIIWLKKRNLLSSSSSTDPSGILGVISTPCWRDVGSWLLHLPREEHVIANAINGDHHFWRTLGHSLAIKALARTDDAHQLSLSTGAR